MMNALVAPAGNDFGSSCDEGVYSEPEFDQLHARLVDPTRPPSPSLSPQCAL